MTQTTRPDAGTSEEAVDGTLVDEIGAPEDEVEDVVAPERPRLELSATQLAAGALAAMTAAIIGARLSVAGTVVGAAVGSVVAGIAGSLYSVSLRRTQHRLAQTPVGSRTTAAIAAAKAASLRAATPKGGRPSADGTGTAAVQPRDARTEMLPATGATAELRTTTTRTLAAEPVMTTVTATPQPVRRRRPWKAVLATAAATFVLTAVGVTAIELVTGQALSGGDGTTISQVRTSGGGAVEQEPMQAPVDEESTAPEDAPTEEAPTAPPTEQPTEQPSEVPTETSTEEPSEEPSETPSDAPTEAPTEQPTEQPSPTPSPSEEPTPASEEGGAATP